MIEELLAHRHDPARGVEAEGTVQAPVTSVEGEKFAFSDRPGSDDDVIVWAGATDELDAASQAFSKVLYEKTEAAGGAEEPAGASAAADSDDDDAIDADFEVKD